MSARTLARLTLLGAVAVLAAPAQAAGPLALCGSGQPYLWPGGGAGIPFNPDQGNLGPLAHAAAVSAVAGAFGAWDAVSTSTVSYTQGAELPVDVDVTNYGPWLDAPGPDGLSAIVFDDTGEIFTELFGFDSGILGFAGPEWGDPLTCTITEGYSFLNGPAFTDPVYAQDVMVHEFGHYTNLAHTAVNGQIFLGDTSGPTPSNTFGDPSTIAVIETMYPFYFGPGSGTATLEADDRASLSRLYPAAGYAAATASIAGTIRSSSGVTRLSGVNVIARNLADPFRDAVSAISGDFAASADQSDPLAGTYTLGGLTPGASYAVFVDQILEGGFSTDPITLPGAEEFYNAGESDNTTVADPPATYSPVTVSAGSPRTGIDVIFNSFRPGDALPVGDDDSVELSLGFPFRLCGQEFTAVHVNANGSLTFGAPSADFTESATDLLAGPPRLAGLWDDLNAGAGGTVTFDRSPGVFTAKWVAVPEYPASGANTFAISLRRSGNKAVFTYGALTAQDGLAGLSCGGKVASGFENARDLRPTSQARRTVELDDRTAAFEIFTAAHPNDLAGAELTFLEFSGSFRDEFSRNDDLAHATRVTLPFDTSSNERYSEIAPVGKDVDYYRFRVKKGDILALEVVRGQFDAVLGVFDATTGQLLAANDDGGGGLLSRLLLQANVDLDLAVAVGAYPDLDFTGAGEEGGRYVLSLRSYRGTILDAGDDTSSLVALPSNFDFQGTRWSSAWVNSNGNVTFGAGSDAFSESAAALVAGPPRIAPLWDDLDASTGLVIAETSRSSTKVHFVSVPEFFSDAPNYFTLELARGGVFSIDYGATARSDSLVGITEGGGATDPGETDLSRNRTTLRRGTTYERFVAPEPFDLSFSQLQFLPFF